MSGRPVSPRTVATRRVVAVVALAAIAVVVWLIVRTIGDATSPEGFSETAGAEVEELEIESQAVGETMPVNVVIPDEAAKGERRPLLVFLHGRGENGEAASLHDEMFAALDEQGERAPIIAFPSGGEGSYWHERASGEWERYVTREVIGEVARRFDADRKRVAIGGISMGGFGAFDIARLNPGRFCAIGGHSPALWLSAAETAEGAFDDADDFVAHDVVGAAATDPAPFLDQPLWLDSGEDDPFRPGIDAFAERLEAAGAELEFKLSPGGHEGEYWRRHWDEYMRFYATSLAEC